MELFNEYGFPVEALFERLDAGEKLEGAEALALLAGDFSNTTHNNYSAEEMFHRSVASDKYKVTVEKKVG